jgi:hypothetical protein
MKRVIILIAFGLFVVQAHAEKARFTGKVLFDLCASDRKSRNFALCAFYVGGFIQGIYTAIAAAEVYKANLFCLPERLTTNDAITVFTRRMRSLRQSELTIFMNENADIALGAMFAAAFPCQKTANWDTTDRSVERCQRSSLRVASYGCGRHCSTSQSSTSRTRHPRYHGADATTI